MTFRYKREVFSRDALLTPVGNITRRPQHPPHSEIGLESELEGFGAHFMPQTVEGYVKPYWITHTDPSLRGESCELVLRRPVSFEELRKNALPEYAKILRDTNFRPALSNRCSLHAHLDFSNKAYYSLLRFTILYTIFELYLFEAVGPQRRGNHFCVALDEAEGFVDRLIKGFVNLDLSAVVDENYRYMAYNMQALFKFGSVELRLHQGVETAEEIQRWADVLEEMLRWADSSWGETPTDLIEQISMNGLEDVTANKFPRLYALIGPVFNKVVGRTGLDLAQDMAYVASWENAPQEAVKVTETKKSKLGSLKAALDGQLPPLQPVQVGLGDNPPDPLDAQRQMGEYLRIMNIQRQAVRQRQPQRPPQRPRPIAWDAPDDDGNF